MAPTGQDLVCLKRQIDNLFLSSHHSSKLCLYQLYGAFQRLICDHITKSQQIDLTDKSMIVQLVKRLIEVTFTNIYRLEIIWD